MRVFLILLLAFVGFSAAASGLIMIAYRDGTMLDPTISLLGPTPFSNYLIPGIFLAFLVGGINLAALFSCIRRHATHFGLALAAGILTSGWIICQMVLIQAANSLHFLYLGISVLIVLMSWQLKGRWAV